MNAIFQREGVDTRPLGKLMLPMYALAMPTIIGVIVVNSVI